MKTPDNVDRLLFNKINNFVNDTCNNSITLVWVIEDNYFNICRDIRKMRRNG